MIHSAMPRRSPSPVLVLGNDGSMRRSNALWHEAFDISAPFNTVDCVNLNLVNYRLRCAEDRVQQPRPKSGVVNYRLELNGPVNSVGRPRRLNSEDEHATVCIGEASDSLREVPAVCVVKIAVPAIMLLLKFNVEVLLPFHLT